MMVSVKELLKLAINCSFYPVESLADAFFEAFWWE